MVNSYVYYTGDGSTTNFQITFDYLSKEFVQVYLDGVPLVVETDYIFTGDRTIVITSVPASGSVVFIRRVTSKNRLVEFRDASILVANDLDISALQAIHIAEEANDNIQNVIQADALGNFDALNRRFVNVATPVDGTDGANKDYVDTRLAAEVAAAEAARDAAIVAQGLSEDARDAAQGFANTAGVRATQAAGSAIVAAQSAQEAQAAQLAAEEISTEAAARAYNYIINGNFDIWQRGTSQTVSGYGSADRWAFHNSGTTKLVSRQVFTLGQAEVGDNPRFYTRNVVTSVAGADNYCYMLQKIERVWTLAGKTATLAFWAKADSNKNIAIEFSQIFGSGGTPSDLVVGIGTQLVQLTTAWTRYVITVDIPSITDKTIGTDAADNIQVRFWFDAGSNLNERTTSLGQQSGTFDIACVSLVEGDIDIKPIPRSYGEELALCQRYYVTTNANDRFYAAGPGVVSNSVIYFQTTMRTPPVATLINTLSTANIQSFDVNSLGSGAVRFVLVAAAIGDCYRWSVYGFDAEL